MHHYYSYKKEISYTGKNFIEDIKPTSKDSVIEFSDEKIIIKRERWYLKIWLNFNYKVLIGLVIVFMLLSLFEDNNKEIIDEFTSLLWYPLVLYVIVNVILLILVFFPPKKEIIFDRLNGIISLPRKFSKKNKILKLRTLEGGYTHRYSNGIEDNDENSTTTFYLKDKYDDFKYKYKKVTEFNTIISSSFNGLWSFILWYMDKNRPLPYDEAFDKFRNKDYQRRKNEGFPAPLIASAIKIEEKGLNFYN